MLAASAIAAPVARSTDAQHFHLKSTGATNESHNNLYVYAYHTGAGLNDAVLTDDVNTASAVYLDGTRAIFDLNSDLTWGVVATGNTNYACEFAQMSARFELELTHFFLSLGTYFDQCRSRQ